MRRGRPAPCAHLAVHVSYIDQLPIVACGAALGVESELAGHLDLEASAGRRDLDGPSPQRIGGGDPAREIDEMTTKVPQGVHSAMAAVPISRWSVKDRCDAARRVNPVRADGKTVCEPAIEADRRLGTQRRKSACVVEAKARGFFDERRDPGGGARLGVLEVQFRRRTDQHGLQALSSEHLVEVAVTRNAARDPIAVANGIGDASQTNVSQPCQSGQIPALDDQAASGDTETHGSDAHPRSGRWGSGRPGMP